MKENDWTKVLGNYSIHRSGLLRNDITGFILKPLVGNHGYMCAVLKSGMDKPKSILLHRLLAIAFIPNPDNLPEINHKDEVKTNNCLDNLEWCTSSHNKLHSAHQQYRQCTLMDPDGNVHKVSGITQFCKDHNLDQSAISRIIHGERRQHKLWMLHDNN